MARVLVAFLSFLADDLSRFFLLAFWVRQMVKRLVSLPLPSPPTLLMPSAPMLVRPPLPLPLPLPLLGPATVDVAPVVVAFSLSLSLEFLEELPFPLVLSFRLPLLSLLLSRLPDNTRFNAAAPLRFVC